MCYEKTEHSDGTWGAGARKVGVSNILGIRLMEYFRKKGDKGHAFEFMCFMVKQMEGGWTGKRSLSSI